MSILFKRARIDPCLFTRFKNEDIVANMVAVYADDIVISCRCEDDANEIKGHLEKRFRMKTWGKLPR
jgi:hypothetical protein